jgi:hypothetical protein
MAANPPGRLVTVLRYETMLDAAVHWRFTKQSVPPEVVRPSAKETAQAATDSRGSTATNDEHVSRPVDISHGFTLYQRPGGNEIVTRASII